MSADLNPVMVAGGVDDTVDIKPVIDKKAPKTSVSIINIALRILEGIGLIFANVFTLGFINFLPGIHKEYSKVFGGKEVEVLTSESEEEDSTSHSLSASEDDADILGEVGGGVPIVEGNRPPVTDGGARPPVVEDADGEGDPPPVFGGDNEVDDTPGCSDQVKKGLGKFGEGVMVAYRGVNRENAQYAWDRTSAGTSWALDQAKSGAQTVWAGCTKENATRAKDFAVQKGGELYETARKPENLRTTVGTIVGLAAATIGTGYYLMSGGSPVDVAETMICVAKNGTAFPC